MRILLLGGTVFLGRALTDAALARGHDVTHLNRGKTSAPDARVETLQADRTDTRALQSAVAGQRWNAVIDTSGYLPQVVRRSAEALRDAAGLYAFVSTISVYADGGFAEGDPEHPPIDPLPDAWAPETYGSLKAMCEDVVREVFGSRAFIVRPGLIVGPNDPTDRFTYWPARISRGGRVLAPDRPERPVQVIDVRDLAAWIVDSVERSLSGTFNATGPERVMTMGEVLQACVATSGSGATLEWVDEAFLKENGVVPWKEMPLWIPDGDGGLLETPIARALAAGLTFRPIAETIRDTIAWDASRPAGREWKAGITEEREKELLAKRRV
ncbi:hypothetical protein BWI17_11825 [Betaproteobacteria bacterium GR16-43]|nr:hypothetical protein BWI17_11825 [Betaproteobacteria bacterium GR16-43]